MSSNKQRATMPRRTEEFDFSAPQSSLKKPPAQRLSRIAQPIRKLSKASLGHGLTENRRSASSDRQSGIPTVANALVQQTPSTGQKIKPPIRSHSATPASRTPLKASENLPLSVPSTIEKNKAPLENRDWMAAQCERICDYLETIHDLPQEFVERRNLKAMSTKQFLVIMNHLFRQIGGSRYKLGNNFIDDIMKTMTELEYPYTINKSMLKTPNVPHSINHIIAMIGWLVQLAPQVNQKPMLLNRDKDVLEEFPSAEYQNFFFDKVQEGFSLWNLKKEEEFAAITEQLTDGLVAARTSGMNQQQVMKRISELEQELVDVNNQTIQQTREQSMDGLARTISEQQQLKKKLQDEIKAIQKQATKIEEDYFQRQQDYYGWVKKIEQVKQEVEAQQLAASERDEIVSAIGINKNLLTAKRLAVSTLEQTSFDHQIALSRMIKQKFNLIANLNTNLHQLANNLKPMINFAAPELDLKTENYAELQQELQAIKLQLGVIASEQSSLYSTLNEQKSNFEHLLSDLQIKLTAVEKSLQETTARHDQLQQQRESLINQLSNISAENAHRKQEDERIRLEKDIVQLQEQCEQNRKAVVKLTVDKRALMAQKLEECQRLLEDKKAQQRELTEQVEQIEAVLAGVERNMPPQV